MTATQQSIAEISHALSRQAPEEIADVDWEPKDAAERMTSFKTFLFLGPLTRQRTNRYYGKRTRGQGKSILALTKAIADIWKRAAACPTLVHLLGR